MSATCVMSLVCVVHPIRGRDMSFLRRCRKEKMEPDSGRPLWWVAKTPTVDFFLLLISSVLHTPVEKKGKVLMSSHRVSYAVG